MWSINPLVDIYNPEWNPLQLYYQCPPLYIVHVYVHVYIACTPSRQWDGHPLGLGLVAEDKFSEFHADCNSVIITFVPSSQKFRIYNYILCSSFVIQHPEREFIICTSYLEIYNEVSVYVHVYVCM